MLELNNFGLLSGAVLPVTDLLVDGNNTLTVTETVYFGDDVPPPTSKPKPK